MANAEPLTLIAHVTTVHSPADTRIFGREARSLARHGYAVSLLAPRAHQSIEDGVSVLPIGLPRGRLGRMFLGTRSAYHLARQLAPSLCHIHDPELLLTGWLLAPQRCALVYDAHEDTAAQILDKEWMPRPLRRPAARIFDVLERRLAARCDAVIAATEAIARRFPRATVVHNYPDLEAFPAPLPRQPQAHARLAYVGGLTRLRGARQMVEALGSLRSQGVSLEVIGTIQPTQLASELAALPGAGRLALHGHRPWHDAWRWVVEHGDIGLLLYQPARNHTEALPTKLFEYMAAGLPVIASDFPLWREIVEGAGAGLLVDPQDPQAIAAAIERLVEDPVLRQTMGENARKAAVEKYNWATEAEKLFALYREVLGEDH
ncbi:MAG: glycosyltransferase family 4 protein [Candidatus Bipolaricaulota bacterium]